MRIKINNALVSIPPVQIYVTNLFSGSVGVTSTLTFQTNLGADYLLTLIESILAVAPGTTSLGSVVQGSVTGSVVSYVFTTTTSTTSSTITSSSTTVTISSTSLSTSSK